MSFLIEPQNNLSQETIIKGPSRKLGNTAEEIQKEAERREALRQQREAALRFVEMFEPRCVPPPESREETPASPPTPKPGTE